MEQEIRALVQDTPQMDRSRSLPGIGFILSAVIALEVGDMGRFLSAERYAPYAGTTPRVQTKDSPNRVGNNAQDASGFHQSLPVKSGITREVSELHR